MKVMKVAGRWENCDKSIILQIIYLFKEKGKIYYWNCILNRTNTTYEINRRSEENTR